MVITRQAEYDALIDMLAVVRRHVDGLDCESPVARMLRDVEPRLFAMATRRSPALTPVDDEGEELTMPAPVEVCSRCGREAPPSVMGEQGRVAQGWVVFEPDDDRRHYALVCPDCLTEEEQSWLSPETLPES